MKILFGLTVLVFAFSFVSSESCTTNTDCTSTTCSGTSSVICQHPDGDGITPGNGLCTCADSGAGQCTTRPDCFGDGAPNLNCPDDRRHCYDNQCICDRFQPGK